MGPACCCWEWSWAEVRRRAAKRKRGARIVVRWAGMRAKEKCFKKGRFARQQRSCMRLGGAMRRVGCVGKEGSYR